MPRDISSGFISEKNKLTNRPIYLYEIDCDNLPDEYKYLAEYDEDVVFGGKTYKAFPITHRVVSENATGRIDRLLVSVGNADRAIQYYLEQYDGLRGYKVCVLLVFADNLDDPDGYIEDVFYIDSVVATEEVIEFTLTSRLDILQVTLPRRRFLARLCQWKFKSAECGYTGSETECNKTFARCKELGNEHRFGGFPGVLGNRIYRIGF